MKQRAPDSCKEKPGGANPQFTICKAIDNQIAAIKAFLDCANRPDYAVYPSWIAIQAGKLADMEKEKKARNCP